MPERTYEIRAVGRRGYTAIPRHLTEWPGIDSHELHLGIWLSTHTGEYMDRLSQRGIARRTNMSHTKVGQALRHLADLGVVTITEGPRGRSWALTFHIETWEALGLEVEATLPVVATTLPLSGSHVATKESKEEPNREGAASPPSRPRNEIWDALREACGMEESEITSSSGFGGLVAQLRKVNATPEEIRARAAAYCRKYGKDRLTPFALVKHWASLRGSPSKQKKRMREIQRPTADGFENLIIEEEWDAAEERWKEVKVDGQP